jgi:hypothetical protein
MSGRLTRSFGIVDGMDLVVEMSADGVIVIREEPVDRRIGRGETLPEVRVTARDVWDNRSSDTPATEAETWVDHLLTTLPVANLSGPPERVGYLAKVWIMNELKRKSGR